MTKKTPLTFFSYDNGKKVYKIKQYYTLTVEQYVKANDRDNAFDVWLDNGGIIHDKITRHLTQEDFDNCETSFIDVDTPDTKVEYIGTVSRVSEDDPYDLECDTLEPENNNKTVPFNKQYGRHV
jgi:hypothetical protein